MSTVMPELGSKISLISKADIRYEGRLFTVDPQECTIALASVRSFGTEDRETQYAVPAQNQVYDYILFRGSDIKDIRVVNNVNFLQPFNDPAIMQLSVPPTLGEQVFKPPPVHPPSMLHFGGGVESQERQSSELLMGGSPQCTVKPPILSPTTIEPNQPVNSHEFIGGSRNTSPASGKSGSTKRMDKRVFPQTPLYRQPQQQYRRPTFESNENSQPQRYQQKRNDYHQHPQHQQQQQQHHSQQHQQHPKRNPEYQSQHSQDYQQRNQENNQQRGNWSYRGPRRQGTRGRNPGYNAAPRNRTANTLKFDNDYDFEQANTEFEELRSQLAKVKLDDATNVPKAEVNGNANKKEDSGNETGTGENEPDDDQQSFYDKTKSFFDNISCEALERAKGKSQRTDWRVERKLNSETFGVAAARRGSYRGRGGFRGMGYRGGYNTQYRYYQHSQHQQHRRNNTTRQENNKNSQQQQQSAVEQPKEPTEQQEKGK